MAATFVPGELVTLHSSCVAARDCLQALLRLILYACPTIQVQLTLLCIGNLPDAGVGVLLWSILYLLQLTWSYVACMAFVIVLCACSDVVCFYSSFLCMSEIEKAGCVTSNALR